MTFISEKRCAERQRAHSKLGFILLLVAACTEAYTELRDRYACGTGCDFMAKQRVVDLLSLLPIAICMEEGIESNVLLMSPDVPENDILTDPGLRKELLPRWWDSDGFKLPQTYIKTVPMDSGVSVIFVLCK